jgi:hypothetical protein
VVSVYGLWNDILPQVERFTVWIKRIWYVMFQH